MIDFDLLTIIIGIVIYVCVCFCIHKKHKQEKIYYVFTTIMFCYFMTVIDVTLFPIIMLDGFQVSFRGRIEYIPFAGLNRLDFFNVIMTVPFGMGMPFLSNKLNNGKRICIAGILFGVTVEVLQFLEVLFTNGSTMRILDINDILFNLFGTLVGFFVLWIFSRFFIKLKEDELNQFWKYVYKVCTSVHIK